MKLNNFAPAIAGSALACACLAAQASSITAYDVPGSSLTSLWSVNDHGVLVGADDAGGFIDDHGVVTVVNLAGTPGYVAGISDDGLAVGSDGTTSFFYKAGVFTPFSVAGEAQTLLRGISANGRYAAGIALAANGKAEGFVLDILDDRLAIMAPPAGKDVFIVQGVNDSGVAVGSLTRGGSSFLFDSVNGTSTYFSALGGVTGLRARTIDNAGDIGGWSIGDGGEFGFLAFASGTVATFSLDQTTMIYGLNNAGLAVGSHNDGDGNDHGFIVNLSAVPEPSTSALLALALVAGSIRLARRRA